MERCEYMKKNPPKGEWDGVWVMKTKQRQTRLKWENWHKKQRQEKRRKKA